MAEQRTTGEPSRLRPEIQVLRAVAVLGVVGDHLFPRLVPGGFIGVDVFFVISGYLITSHLLRELDGTGRLRLAAFWARRARRLVPASAVVLATSVLVTFLAVPQTLWKEVMRQIVASALFFQNWLLAHDAQDYFRSAESPSPVTHYWSLSLEEQFYLVWPLLALAAYAVGRRHARPRLALGVVFGVVVAASLAYSVVHTAHDPSAAYFVTPTRMWQLGTGGLLALVPTVSAGTAAGIGVRRLTALLGWAGILGACFLFSDTTPVPGWISLVPVLGVCLVISSGDAWMNGRTAPARAVVATAVWFGAISYSLYLWHWPLIVLTPYVDGRPLTTLTRLLVLAASVAIAYASLRLVEDPVRRWRPVAIGPAYRSLLPAGAALLVLVGCASAASHQVDDRLARITHLVDAASTSGAPCFGARAAVHTCPGQHTLRYEDSPLLTRLSYPSTVHGGSVCIQDPAEAAVLQCSFGVPAGTAKEGVALVGDSHARHWAPALDELASEHQWHVQMFAKGSCPFNAAAVTTRNFPENAESCHQWVDAVADRIARDPSISTVFTSSYSRNYAVTGRSGKAGRAAMVAGYREAWKRLTDAGKSVVVIADVPQPHEGDIPTCVSLSSGADDPCSVPRARALTPDPLVRAARSGVASGVVGVDLHRFFCDDRRCHVVIGGVVAYGDDNHMIGFFARTLAPYLDHEVRRRLGARE